MAKSKMMRIQETNTATPCVFLYVRVSTDRQAEEGYSIEIQKERLAAYVTSQFGSKKNVEVEYFIDDGYSGGSLNRPEIKRMIEEIKNGRGTHVVVYKLDRLSRSQKDTLYLIEDVFLTHNVAFVSMQESFNTASAFGRAVVGILSVFAQLERENIFERTRSGMRKRVESGLWMGGGRVPYGYDYDRQKGILVPNKDAEKVRMLYDLYIKGESLQKIANLLGLKYDKLAYQILTRKSNAGYIVYNGVEYKGQHEAIVSLDTYERAIAILKERSIKHHTSKSEHLLTGLVTCGVCGAKMRYIKWGKDGYRFMCNSRQKSKPYLVKDPDCDNEYADADEIESIVLRDLFSMSKDVITPGNEPHTVEVADILQNRYNELSKKLKRLYNLYADHGDEILLDTIDDIKKEMKDINERISAEEERGFWTRNIARAKEDLRNISDTWEYMTISEQRAIIHSVVDAIVITHDHVDVKYKF